MERDPATKADDKQFNGNVNDTKAKTKGRIDRSKITPESILKQAQEIFKPYTIEMTDLSWYTGYQIDKELVHSFLSKTVFSFLAMHAILILLKLAKE